MVKFQRIRTLWGVEPGKDMENWDKLFPELKQIGFGRSTPTRKAYLPLYVRNM